MGLLSEKNIRTHLLIFLSNLQNTATVRERQTLVDYTGFHRLTSQISWEGDTLTFFGGLVNLLAHDTPESLLEFLDKLAESEYVPFERKQELATLSKAIASFTPEQWNKAFTSGDLDIQEIIKRFQKGKRTRKEDRWQ